ncbi:pseudaminic acid biosynthesis-associated methylase [Prochlorococcus marinus str. MU1404]|uniref:pseudaminic acid biosynthesis-associated methylase n=1 Tax=Prochlorococcus marinus TaxID=1219 RepID=UPI001ADC78E6|nr:methyltransferase [Prochlorococcus marinus XMU1404]MBW3073592.1 pseudaminic acid biosynthesis-associated methylase [Prochlorococcus marinus str. MU1404]MCR8545121.1 methyltransferase [Prochlorococcus marinus CUG1432]
MKKFETEQENFWAGEFGNDYIERNKNSELVEYNLNLFSKALGKKNNFANCIEFGSNIGNNIKALKKLYPDLEFHAVEINEEAIEILKEEIPNENIIKNSILNFESDQKWDLVLIKGVLIHINPSMLEKVYKILVKATNKYLLLAEYYSRNPETLDYRGFEEKLYKRDFAGEILDLYPEMILIDYGFAYHRDTRFPLDINWFLLEKS